MRKGAFLVLLSVAVLAYFPNAALAQMGGHGHGNPSASSAGMGSGEMPMNKGAAQAVSVEGLKITFEVMDMSEHMSMPGMSMKGNPQHSASEHSQSHALMVTIQDAASKEIISDAKIGYTITSPSGAKETGRLEWSGDHYTGGFSPKGKGVYRVQLRIESGGMEREARFTHKM